MMNNLVGYLHYPQYQEHVWVIDRYQLYRRWVRKIPTKICSNYQTLNSTIWQSGRTTVNIDNLIWSQQETGKSRAWSKLQWSVCAQSWWSTLRCIASLISCSDATLTPAPLHTAHGQWRYLQHLWHTTTTTTGDIKWNLTINTHHTPPHEGK